MKKLLTLIPLLVIGILFFTGVDAVVLAPSSGTYAPGSIAKINLSALLPTGAPDGSVDGIVIDLTVVGGTVTGYTPPSDLSIDATGNCPGNSMYTSGSVCVLLGKNAGHFNNTDNLGFFNVQWGSAGTATVTKTSNNIYIDSGNNDEFPDTGEAASFNISANTPTPTATRTPTPSPTPTGRLPESGIEDSGGPILIGLIILTSGIILYKYSTSNYKLNNE